MEGKGEAEEVAAEAGRVVVGFASLPGGG